MGNPPPSPRAPPTPTNLLQYVSCAASEDAASCAAQRGSGNVTICEWTSPGLCQAIFRMVRVSPEFNVLSGVARVHVLWYGDWDRETLPVGPLWDLLSGLGQSEYWRVLSKGYFSPPGAYVTASIYPGEQAFTPPCATYQPLWGAGALVEDAISRGALPLDGNAIYLVLGAAGVLGGGYHGGLGYGNSSVSFCGTDGTLDDVGCILHELAESAVNSAWTTNVTFGSWEVADVCDCVEDPVNITFGARTFLSCQKLFDVRTQTCATWTPPPSPSFLPYRPAQNSTPAPPGLLGTLDCASASTSSPGPAVAAAATVAALVAAALLGAWATPKRERTWTHIVHLLTALAAAATAVLVAALATEPVPPTQQTSPNAPTWFVAGKAWAIQVPLRDVLVQAGVFSPLRLAVSSYGPQTLLSAIALVLAVLAPELQLRAAWLAAAAADALLAGAAALPAAVTGLGASQAVCGLATAAAVAAGVSAHACDTPAREGWAPAAGAGVLSVLNLGLGSLLLAQRGQAAVSLTVENLQRACSSYADDAVSCALVAGCGHDSFSGMPNMSPLSQPGLRLGVGLGFAYGLTGGLAVCAAAAWFALSLASFRGASRATSGFCVSTMVLQAAVFGSWLPLLAPITTRSLAPAEVRQAAATLGCTFTSSVPASASAGSGLVCTTFVLGAIAAALPLPPRPRFTHLLAARAVVAASLFAAAVAALSYGAAAATATPNAPTHPIRPATVPLVNVSAPLVSVQAPTLVFSPTRDTAACFSPIGWLAAAGAVAAAADAWPPITLALATGALGAAAPTQRGALIAPAVLATLAAAWPPLHMHRWRRHPHAPALRAAGLFAVAALVLLNATTAGFSFAALRGQAQVSLQLSVQRGSRGALVNSILLSYPYNGEGLVSGARFSSSLKPAAGAAGGSALAALLAWVAFAVTGRPATACAALALQSFLAGACAPFETLALRRGLMPAATSQIAALLGWQATTTLPPVVSAATWCSVLGVAAGLGLYAAVDAEARQRARPPQSRPPRQDLRI